jgi:ABC-type nitrate/sulfonate/bicarbonate transport system substrate-binding protein
LGSASASKRIGEGASGVPHPFVLRGRRTPVRIISNNGAENDSLEALLRAQGYLDEAGLEAEFVKVDGPARNLSGLLDGGADLCVVSALNPLPDIVRGAPAKLIGSAMKRAALSVFARSPGIRSVADLVGRRIGIGPRHYVLHMSVLALLRKREIDPAAVTFVQTGSNAQVFRAVAEGRVDAGPSSVVSFYYQDKLGVHSLSDADMWTELPDYTYQTMYASDRAIADKRDAIMRCLSAYARLFRFLQGPGSWEAYRQARATALPENDADEASAVWKFMQEQKPYGFDLAIPDDRLRGMQELFAAVGAIDAPVRLEQIADMSMARDAIQQLN